jgi:hypothetical protein
MTFPLTSKLGHDICRRPLYNRTGGERFFEVAIAMISTATCSVE